MSTPISEYIFSDAQNLKELERLQAIEQIFDPKTRQRILTTGITNKWQCLEVGAGAGSIAQWLATIVGESGKVVAVDIDTRFSANVQSSNLEVLQADVRHLALENQSFDLIHARYLLIHILDFEVALSKMLDLLKPGGWIVIEEPDFSVAKAIVGENRMCQSFQRVNLAIQQMFADKGMDYALGGKLPGIFQKYDWQKLSLENDTPVSAGGSGIAKMMKMSTMQLAQKYIATSKATQSDIENFYLFADDPNTSAIYYATVAVIAQKSDVKLNPVALV
ncbi:MAG: class I SAM-dependent methyltransferase [Okeania sp. SIO2F4]|uniref:class I SAM-dependent methyltransferase n=1 Tax=Okeania sp. SIO2F4 TaxID=2607790 RepID=UPI0014297BF0|nr:class I SAM-dependent methyltransferase [Okeania sp. SIO2F4]NES03658.1 class I SAM-dependent methyltransferase [Okeania sp. SIO2F4]